MFDRKKWRGTGGTARLSAAQRTTNITASLTPANRIKFLRELLPRTVFFSITCTYCIYKVSSIQSGHS